MDDSIRVTTLGRYRLLRRIGRGGMGEVWLAEDPHLHRQVAVKVLPLHTRDDQEFLQRFEREARAAAALHHPHIVAVHDYGQQHLSDEQTVTYLVMPYIAGGSLADCLRAAAAIGWEQALGYLFQVAEAIDFAHTHGIIHRDIKPANLLLREDGWLLLSDFGIARLLIDEHTSTPTGALLGTPTYMAPEQAQGHAVPASDLYSLAIIAYQLFTRHLPFQAENPYALTFQHAFATAPAPHEYNPALSVAFEEALLRGMAKDPTRRPLTAVAFVTSLQQALQVQPPPSRAQVWEVSPSPVPLETPDRPAQRQIRRRVLIGAGISTLLVAGTAAAAAPGLLTRRQPSTLGAASPSAYPTASAGASPAVAITAAFNRAVTQLAWSPSASRLLAVSQDATSLDNGMCRLWDFSAASQTTPPVQLAVQNFANGGNGLLPTWSPDGSTIALANAGRTSALGAEVRLYRSDLSAPLSAAPATAVSLSRQANFCGLSWPSQSVLLTLEIGPGSDHLLLNVWNMQNLSSAPLTAPINQEPGLELITATPPNLLAVSFAGPIALGFGAGLQAGIVVPANGQNVWRPRSPLLSVQGEVGLIGWSATGRYLAASGGANPSAHQLGLWDATGQYRALEPALDFSQLSSVPVCFAWGPASRGHLLAVGGVSGQIGLWLVGERPSPVYLFAGTAAGSVRSLAWSADGRWLAASYDDAAASILIWRL